MSDSASARSSTVAFSPNCCEMWFATCHICPFFPLHFSFFHQGDRTLSRRNCPKPLYSQAGCIVEPYNTACTTILIKLGKGHQCNMCACVRDIPRFITQHMHTKHCKRMAPLYKHMGKLQRVITNSKARIEIPKGQIPAFYPFCITILIKLSKGRQCNMCACVRLFPVYHTAHAHKTLQTNGFPVQTYGKTSKGHNFNSKAWIKIPKGQNPAFDPFCMPVQKLCPQVLPVPHWIH